MLFVDAGDFAGDPNPPGLMQTETLVDGMNAIGYQVANLSPRELGHGYDAYLRLKERARFDLVSANVVWQDTGEPIAPATVVRRVALREGAKAKELRFGFIGLSRHNAAFMKEGPGGRRIVTVDPLAAAAKHVPLLRQKADVIVALVALEVEACRQLARRAREIDLIVGGHGGLQTRPDDFPEDTKIGRTRLFAIGDQGKNLGEVRLFFGPEKTIASAPRAAISLSREWPDDPALARIIETTKVAINDYHKAQADGASPFAPAAPGTPPPGPGVAPAPAPAADAATYTGSDRCAPCHESAFATWARSSHAHAFDTLVRASQDFNPRCVGCHTIGFGKPNGFVNVRSTPGLVHVGCESCHGPSSLHPESVLEGYGRTDTQFCLSCHTGENSPDYKPAEYVPKVLHWNGAPASP